MNQTAVNLLCDNTNSLLFIVDMQERLSSAMPNKIIQHVIKNCQLLTQAANLLGIPVVVSEQYPKGLGNTLSSITASLPESVQIHEKICFSCASNQNISQAIDVLNKKQIIIVGMEAHVCILQTAIELQQKGYQIFIAADSVCSRSKQHYLNALQRLQQAGCVITNYESVCFEWLRDAKHDQFKDVSKLLK